jgi:prepilin-type N-terminal cleavage/methylation domain-containing protein
MNPPRHNAAFSLVEVMIAILILGIAIAGLVHGITTALASNKESELQTVAAFFAQGKIEELRAAQLIEDGQSDGACGAVLSLYRWRQTVSGTEIPGLHEVNVVVEQAQTGREIYELKTMLFEPDDDSDTRPNGSRKDSKSKNRRSRQS